jgi:CheY-like chemotaxis protein
MLIVNRKEGERTILIIDDENLNFFSLAAILKTKGYRCLSAENAAEAFDVLKNNPEIKAILMDIMMPGIDGFKTTRAIKEDERYGHIPVLVFTALDTSEDKDKALASGANAFLSKPVSTDQLLEQLNHAIEPAG